MFVWGRIGTLMPFGGTYDGANMFRLCMAADIGGHPDPLNWVGVGLGYYTGSGQRVFQGATCIAGTRSDIPSSGNTASVDGNAPYEYFGIHKRTNAYDFWAFNDSLAREYLGSLSTSMTLAWLGFEWTLGQGAQTPGVPVHCCDFIRRLDNVTTFPF
jgi:hypothetical protein